MNKEQELKIEILSLQRENLVKKARNLKMQINQLDEKIDRIRNFSNNQQSRKEEQSDIEGSASRSKNSNETTEF